MRIVNVEEWLEADTSIDPVLIEPLDLPAARLKRRHVATALGAELGAGDTQPLTQVVLLGMVDELADVVVVRRVSVRERAPRIVTAAGAVHDRDALQVIIDFRWDNARVNAGTIRAVLDQAPAIYTERMTATVTAMLRRWERTGIIDDVSR
ncbi:MAG: hypothetical protein ACXIVQ_12135 [Acidimicrobiales bacterium]